MKRRRGPRRAAYAFTLTEMLFAAGTILLVLFVILELSRHAMINLDRRRIESGQSNNARTGVDEMLSQLRYANKVLVSQSLSGTNYTSGNTTIVVSAQGYDPATSAVFLTGATDYIAFQYDATSQKLMETCLPGAGSVRPSRTSMRIAQGIDGLSFTYRVRDNFTASAVGTAIYTLSANATATPTVAIDGVAGTGVWTSATPNRITVIAPSAKSNIQISYPVSPTADGGAALQYVKQVSVNVHFSDSDARAITHSLSMIGSVRLRNQRQ